MQRKKFSTLLFIPRHIFLGFDKVKPSYLVVLLHRDGLYPGLFHEFQELSCTVVQRRDTCPFYRIIQQDC